MPLFAELHTSAPETLTELMHLGPDGQAITKESLTTVLKREVGDPESYDSFEALLDAYERAYRTHAPGLWNQLAPQFGRWRLALAEQP